MGLAAATVFLACDVQAGMLDLLLDVADSLLDDGPIEVHKARPPLDPAPPDRPTTLSRATSSFLYADYRQRRLTWMRAWTKDAYAAHGQRHPEWDTDALAAIDAYAACVWPLDAADSERAAGLVRHHARQAREVGCPDALLVMLEGYALLLDRDEEAAGNLLERAAEELASQGYPETLRCLALKHLHDSVTYSFTVSSRKQRFDTLTAELATSVLRAAEDSVYGPAELGFYADLFAEIDDINSVYKAIAEALRNLKGPSNPWANAYVRGHSGTEFLYGYANDWAVRNGLIAGGDREGFARSVREALTQAHQLRPDLPHAATDMLYVDARLTQRGSAGYAWYRLATAACPDWPPAFESLARFPALAEIARSPDHWTNILLMALHDPQPGSDMWTAIVPSWRRALWAGSPPLHEAIAGPRVWPLARAHLRQIGEDTARSAGDRGMAWERLAAAAWQARDLETALQANRMRARPLSDATSEAFRLGTGEFEGLIALASGEAGEPLADAWRRYMTADDADALRRVLAGLDDPALAPSIRHALRRHLHRVALQPGQATAVVLAEGLVQAGMTERLWKECQRLWRATDGNGAAQLRETIVRLLGPVAARAAEMPELAINHAPQRLPTQRARVVEALAAVGTPEQADITQRKLAEFRVLLQLDEEGWGDDSKARCQEHAKLELMPAMRAVPDQLAVLDVPLEHAHFANWHSRWGYIYRAFWREFLYHQRPLWEQPDVEVGIVARLDEEQDATRLAAAAREALSSRGSLTLELRIARWLRRRGLVVEAERHEEHVADMVRVLTGADAVPGDLPGTPPHGRMRYRMLASSIEFGVMAAYLYNLVEGYEDHVPALCAVASAWDRASGFIHLLAADANLRKGRALEAAQNLRMASERPMKGWKDISTPHGDFATPAEYLRFVEDAVAEALLSDTGPGEAEPLPEAAAREP